MKLSEFLKKEWLMLALIFAPFAMIVGLWDKIPANVPMHWNNRKSN